MRRENKDTKVSNFSARTFTNALLSCYVDPLQLHSGNDEMTTTMKTTMMMNMSMTMMMHMTMTMTTVMMIVVQFLVKKDLDIQIMVTHRYVELSAYYQIIIT